MLRRVPQTCRTLSEPKQGSAASNSHWYAGGGGCATGVTLRAKIIKFALPLTTKTLRHKALTASRLCVFVVGLKCALERRETEGGMEIAIEFVVLAERQIHDALQLFDVVDVYDRVDVVEKGGVRVHRAQ